MAQPPTDTSNRIRHGGRIRLACLNCDREDFNGVDVLPDDWEGFPMRKDYVIPDHPYLTPDPMHEL